MSMRNDYQNADGELADDLERSIFIFPNPGSESSPSSPLSIATDVSFPSDSAMTTATRGRRGNSLSTDWEALSPRSVSVDSSSLRSPLVEIWEMSSVENAEPGANADDMGTTELEAAVERAGRKDALVLHGSQRRYPLGRQPFPNTFTYVDGRFQIRGRERTESLISAVDGEDSSPHGRMKSASVSNPSSFQRSHSHRLPLLSFFSSFFSIDDSTLHLLTRPPHPLASPLFQGARLQSGDDADTMLNDKHILFSSSEMASLKEGVEAATDPSVTPHNIFALPLPSLTSLPSLPFACMWYLVNGAYSAPKRMWVGTRHQA
ncbi:hypothetical protein DFH11DRAFT_1329832 [Phellopilus nigrolimitatus]|nr:hypothetical protein DFH11DRAFT_1329832 [Phellopilus nigrolimitatus]